jgi:hypothetical protein
MASTCLVFDNGDAKINDFKLIPTSGPQETTFGIDFSYTTVNGTAPGEVRVLVQTVDGIPVEMNLFSEDKGPGIGYKFISLSTLSDPQCDPTVRECRHSSSLHDDASFAL